MGILSPFFIDNSNSKNNFDYFYGYCVDDYGNIYIGNDGWDKKIYPPPLDGRYAWIKISDRKVTARTDITGQENLFYYCANDYWAMSNSFYLLTKIIKQNGLKLTVNLSTLACFKLQSGKHISAQLMSHNTLANEIRLLPQNCQLEIENNNNNFSARELRYFDFSEHVPESIDEYRSMMIFFAEKMVGQVAAFSRAGYKLQLSLSAGYDSREILAAVAVAKDLHPEMDVRVFSVPESDEFEISKKIAKNCGMCIEPRNLMFEHQYSKTKFSPTEAVNNWLIAHGGTYMPVLIPVSAITEDRDYIDLWGYVSYEWDYYLREDGAKKSHPVVLKTDEIAEKIQDSNLNQIDKDLVEKEFFGFFKDLGIDESMEHAMDLYYMGTRARHHYGRNWFKGLQNKGVALGFLARREQILLNWYCSINKLDKRQFHKDLLTVLLPKLNQFEFDSKWKDLTTIDSLFSDPSITIKPVDYCIHGHYLDKDHLLNSMFHYGRALSSEISIGSSFKNISEIFKSIAQNSISDPYFISLMGENFIEEVKRDLNSIALDLPPEINCPITMAVNLFTVINAIEKTSHNWAKLSNSMSVGAKLISNKIIVTIATNLQNVEDLEYAYYLFNGAKRIQTVWYQKNNEYTFDLNSFLENEKLEQFSVTGFIRRPGVDGVINRRVIVNGQSVY